MRIYKLPSWNICVEVKVEGVGAPHLSWWKCPPPSLSLGSPAAPSPLHLLNFSSVSFWTWRKPIFQSAAPAGRKTPWQSLQGCWQPWWSGWVDEGSEGLSECWRKSRMAFRRSWRMNILHLKDIQTPTAFRISWQWSRHLETGSCLFGPHGYWQDSLLHLKLK